MKLVAFLLNAPYTISGLILALLSIPSHWAFDSEHAAIVINVRSFWWRLNPKKIQSVRASTTGHVVLLGPKVKHSDLEHELVHVEQITAQPFIQPILYTIESLRVGYKDNKYEQEARQKTRK